MSALKTEETGERLVPAPPSIDYDASVPFKKRRFLFIGPPSPPLLQDESTEAKKTELFSPSDSSVVLKSSVAVEHPPSSVEEPSFCLESSENINFNEVDGGHSDDQDKHFSLIQKRSEFPKGRELSPSSDAPHVDLKDKSDEKKNLVLSDRTWGSTEIMSVPSGSHDSEVTQGSGGHQNIEGYGLSTDLTLTFGQNIGPVCWLQANSSLSCREREPCLVGVDRSKWDLNATMDDSGGCALVFSRDTAPCGNSISALRENDKDAEQNLHMVEHRSVDDRSPSSYDYKEHHPGRCLDLGQSCDRLEGDVSNPSADCTMTNVDTNDSEVKNENNKKRDDVMAKLIPKEDLFCAAKEIVKGDGENSACNGGKIEISGCEDSDSCDYNYESDRVMSVLADHVEIYEEEDDDYEDGEVREQFVLDLSQTGRGAEQVENVRASAYYCTRLTTNLSVACEEANIELQPTATSACNRNVEDQIQSRELSLKEGVSSNPNCSFHLCEFIDGDLTRRIKKEMVSSAVNDPSVTQHGVNERVQTDRAIGIEVEDGNSLPETEVLVNSEVTSEEDSKRRIITLSSLSSVSSPDKARFVANRPRLPDMAVEVDKIHLRGRNRTCVDVFDEFSRGRNQYSFYRNSRSKFGWDSRIVSNSIVRNRDVKREFIAELYNYPVECETTRCRSIYDSGYRNLASEGQIRGDGPYFHRQSSTRRYPGRRDGAHARAIPRDSSPVGCNEVDGFDMVSLRSTSKFMRDPRDDNLDSRFACSRISCDYDSGGIAYEDRKLPSFKSRRVLSRSNSPMIRSRSPIQGSNWRRSPEGFRGHLELSHRRSPPVYLKNRIRSRSPGWGWFHGKMMRRQNPRLSQNLEESRQMRSERDNVFPRSRLTSRSSPDRGTFRIRRYNGSTRDRPCNEYSKGNMRTLSSKGINRHGESNERSFNEEGGAHERFPSPFDETDVSDTYSTDEAVTPYHFCPGDRPVYRERGNSSVKPIDMTKNQSSYIRKSHKLEKQEGSYRRRRMDEEFDDDRGTRKRFCDPELQD